MYDDCTSNLTQNCSVMSGNKVIVKNNKESGRGIETDNQGNKKKFPFGNDGAWGAKMYRERGVVGNRNNGKRNLMLTVIR